MDNFQQQQVIVFCQNILVAQNKWQVEAKHVDDRIREFRENINEWNGSGQWEIKLDTSISKLVLEYETIQSRNKVAYVLFANEGFPQYDLILQKYNLFLKELKAAGKASSACRGRTKWLEEASWLPNNQKQIEEYLNYRTTDFEECVTHFEAAKTAALELQVTLNLLLR